MAFVRLPNNHMDGHRKLMKRGLRKKGYRTPIPIALHTVSKNSVFTTIGYSYKQYRCVKRYPYHSERKFEPGEVILSLVQMYWFHNSKSPKVIMSSTRHFKVLFLSTWILPLFNENTGLVVCLKICILSYLLSDVTTSPTTTTICIPFFHLYLLLHCSTSHL